MKLISIYATTLSKGFTTVYTIHAMVSKKQK